MSQSNQAEAFSVPPQDVPPPHEAPLHDDLPRLDADQQGRLCALVAVGMAARTAAELVVGDAAALDRTTAAEGRFAAQLMQSAAGHEATLLARIGQAAQSPGQWRAAAWLLERTRPDAYGRGRASTITHAQFDKQMRTFVRGLIDCVQDPAARRQILQYIRQQDIEADSPSPAPAPPTPSSAEPSAGLSKSQSEASARPSDSQSDASASKSKRKPGASARKRRRSRPRSPATRPQPPPNVPDCQPYHLPPAPPTRGDPARGQQKPVGSALRGVP